MEEGENRYSAKDDKPASKSPDTAESINSKRINKRKQRFPTKQSTETLKSLHDVIQQSKDKGEKIKQKVGAEKFNHKEDKDIAKICVVKVTKKGIDGNEIRNSSEKEKDDKDLDQNVDDAVTPRRSSRAPKKKKMFGFDDSEEENDTPSTKKVKKSTLNKSKGVKKNTNRQDTDEKVTKLNPVEITVNDKEEPDFHEERETIGSEETIKADTVGIKTPLKTVESNELDKSIDNVKEVVKDTQSIKEDLNTQKQVGVQKQMSPYVSNISLAEYKKSISKGDDESNRKTVTEERNRSPLLSMKEELRVINAGRKYASDVEPTKGKDQGMVKTDGSEDHVTDTEVSDVEGIGDVVDDSDSDYEIYEEDGDSDDDLDKDFEHTRKTNNSVNNDPDNDAFAGSKTEKENNNDAENMLRETSKCSVCENTFTSRKNLRRHMLTVHNAVQDFQCSECETVLRSKKAYERHLTLHSENSYKCLECGKSFISLGKVQRHVHETHKGAMPFRCGYDNCEKQFSNSSNRRKHIAAVHLNIRRHNCHFCPKMFKNSSALRVHMYSAHEDQFQDRPKFECEVCHKVFGHRMKLKIHETVHSSIRPYSCKFEDCGRTFRLKSNKIKHERVHENIRPYQCDKCNQAFSRKVYLETHQYKHTGIKKFQCPTCNKTFSQKGNLDIHMKIHSENRPMFACERCSKRFTNKSNLTKHMQTVCREGAKVHSKKLLERYVIQQAGDGTSNDISAILQEVNEIVQGDTVFIIKDENTGKIIQKMDKACGTDELGSKNRIVPEGSVCKQKNLIVNTFQPTQTSQLERIIVTDLKPKSSKEITEESQCNGTENPIIYIENDGGVEAKIPTQDELIQQVTETETVTYTELGNVAEASNTLADIINPASSENVEYEIVSSGLDGVEEGILKEFLSKWNQQSTPPGTTVILDVQNQDNSIGVDGSGLPDSVQYIVTVKDQE